MAPILSKADDVMSEGSLGFKESEDSPRRQMEIGFDPSLVSLVLSGEKTVTWRLFDRRKWDDNPELLFVQSPENTPFAKAQIVSVERKTFRDMTTEDKQGHESFSSDDEMIATYQKYYGSRGEVTMDTEVTIVRFELTDIESNK